MKYRELEDELHRLTDENRSKFDLYEWWEADGVENLFSSILSNHDKTQKLFKSN
ncbi:hypothetical protein V9L05_01065 [Bernardetia sp. Wsw4-3y2]|uniref:hypothetical protein n=1 Tax=Bernardetia sp. Wsw4-3y2 TaxID=3127471 RepID=UPI0030D22B93